MLGRYPGTHGIIGNQFYDPTPLMGYRASSQSQGSNMINSNSRRPPVKYFNYEDERTTGEIRWWEKAKPIWATAKEQGINFTTLLWSR